ncbi:PucR family transcriptional regulator [Caproiciproducens faecalis]|uniref:Helix-turn-helix domain-containing protein n=1 Tax=Caproiciproducens faecalis TaxID=2820301 RepID=A0ABS7DLT8_9FIRM|nr:helix-turn-helix domain-containing protein [Caproiciproducens faecalis]MBW7572069.1 helix-turn-helix domain-containing protein [Caproiciproducens faecalis]
MIAILSGKLKIDQQITSNNSQIYELKELNLQSELNNCKNDILYFVRDATCLKDAVPQNLIYVECTSDEVRKCFVNSAQVEADSFQPAMAFACDLLNRAYRMQALYSSMLHMILDGKGISGILSDIADRAESSIVMIDMSGKIMAHSSPFRLQNPLWTQSVKQGYCPTEFMEHIRKLRQEKGKLPGSDPYVRVCEEMQLFYLCSKISKNDTLFGYIFMIQPDSEFGADCYEMLSIVSKALTETTLKHQNKITLQSHLYGEMLTDMLNGISEKQAETRIHVSELTFPNYMRVLTVKPLYYHGEVSLAASIQPQLETIFLVEQSIVYQKSIVLIIGVKKDRTIPPEQLEQLRALCAQNYLLAGISNSFSNPTKFPEYYRQAEKAVILSQRMDADGFIHSYVDYAFFDMLDNLPEELRLMRYCHPALPLLREYDRQKGTKLYETLRSFTLTGFNQNRTAELLFLHRNTLNYRRQKIMQLCGIDLEDSQTKFLLSYSFAIDLFLEKNTLYS